MYIQGLAYVRVNMEVRYTRRSQLRSKHVHDRRLDQSDASDEERAVDEDGEGWRLLELLELGLGSSGGGWETAVKTWHAEHCVFVGVCVFVSACPL